MPGLKPPDRDSLHAMRAFALVGQLGLIMALPICGGLFAGMFLDGLAQTGGVFVALGILIGIATGVYGVYRILLREIS